MPTIKYDVSGSDPERALQNFEPPKPGVYLCKIVECNPHLAKGADGKPDRSKPSIELILSVQNKGDFYGSRVWDYVSLSEDAKWKMDQFLMAVGIASATDNRKGAFKTEDQVDKLIKVRVVADRGGESTPYGGDNYRPKVGALMAPTGDLPESGDGDDPFAGGGDDDPFAEQAGSGGDDADPFGGSDSSEEKASESGGDESLDDGYDEMNVQDLRKELHSRGLDHKGAKPALISRLRENDNDEEPF